MSMPRVSPALAALMGHLAPAAQRATEGLWRRDPSVWSGDAAEQRSIANRLGWLAAPETTADRLDEITTFADDVQRAAFRDVVLLGMGGSSLAPEVLRVVGGINQGWPRFHVLDSTDPAAIQALCAEPDSTLFILASKSGTTIEPNALAAHFRRSVTRWGDHVAAITDEGTELAARARAEGFRKAFINPGDIGGRYSALSFFGLVPAALMGQDVQAMLGWALAMLAAADPAAHTVESNPAASLGLALGAAAQTGRDKLTLLVPDSFGAFGLWVEQLVAESTGKRGVGIVPIVGEAPGSLRVYGQDRLFVRVRTPDSAGERERDSLFRELDNSGALAVTIDVAEFAALGAEFVRWEVATAVAGALLSINPFDEPNVQQAKDATRALLAEYQSTGRLPLPHPDRNVPGGVTVSLTSGARSPLAGGGGHLLDLLREGDYFGLLAYLGPDPALAAVLDRARLAVRDRTRNATSLGFGPRYLHSTGQLHKGGPNTGVFVLVTATPHEDIDVPDAPFSFGTLELAQALGDFQSLDRTGRRAVHLHLPSPDAGLLRAALDDVLGLGQV